MSRGTRAGAVAVGLLLAQGLAAGPAAADGWSPAPVIPASHDLAVLSADVPAFRSPDPGTPSIATVRGRRPLTLDRTTLPVLARVVDGHGRTWLQVRLPGRAFRRGPVPPTGWVRAADTERRVTAWHVVVDVRARRVLAYRDGRRVRSFRAIVGARATPTPRGAWFVEENLRLPAGRAGAPFALAMSARSPVLQEFDGGPGQIAVHGRGGVGGRLGTAVSHGCIRLSDRAVSWLAARIRPGVPVTVR